MNKPRSQYVTGKIGSLAIYNRKNADFRQKKVDAHYLPPAGIHSRFYSIIKARQGMSENKAASDALLDPLYDESPDLFGAEG